MSDSRTIPLNVSDVSGQKMFRIELGPDATVDDVIKVLLTSSSISSIDSQGTPQTFHARLDREGRHLHASERIGDALLPNDHIVLQPNIDAGTSSR